MLSYDLSHNIIVGLFHDKKYCNCINLFPCIFVRFICNGFSIKWWSFDQDSWRSHEKHMQEGEQLSQVPTQYSLSKKVTCDLDSWLAPVASDPWSSHVLLKIVTFRILFTPTIYTLITHRNGKEAIERKTLRKVSTTHPPY